VYLEVRTGCSAYHLPELSGVSQFGWLDNDHASIRCEDPGSLFQVFRPLFGSLLHQLIGHVLKHNQINGRGEQERLDISKIPVYHRICSDPGFFAWELRNKVPVAFMKLFGSFKSKEFSRKFW